MYFPINKRFCMYTYFIINDNNIAVCQCWLWLAWQRVVNGPIKWVWDNLTTEASVERNAVFHNIQTKFNSSLASRQGTHEIRIVRFYVEKFRISQICFPITSFTALLVSGIFRLPTAGTLSSISIHYNKPAFYSSSCQIQWNIFQIQNFSESVPKSDDKL